MRRLVWAFAGHTFHIVGNLMSWLIYMTVCDMQIDIKPGPEGSPRWLERHLQRDFKTVVSGIFALNKVDPCDSSVWDLPCMQLASYLERSPLMWMMLLHLHVNLKAANDDDDDCRRPDCLFVLYPQSCLDNLAMAHPSTDEMGKH